MKQVDLSAIAELAASACLATRVRQLSRIITRVYDDALRPLSITSSQYTLLAQIAAREGILAVDIVRELDIEKSSLSRNLKRLTVSELIIQGPQEGRRGMQLFLTPKGRECLREAFPKWKKTQEAMNIAMEDGSKKIVDALLASAESLRIRTIHPIRPRRNTQKMAPEARA